MLLISFDSISSHPALNGRRALAVQIGAYVFAALALVGISAFATGCGASLSTNEIHAPNMDVVDVNTQSAFTRTHRRVFKTTNELPPQAGLPGYGGYDYGRGYPGRGPYYGGVGYPTIVVASVAPLGAVPAPSATLVVAPVPMQQSASQQPAQQGEATDKKAREVIKDTVKTVNEQDERIKKLEEQLGKK